MVGDFLNGNPEIVEQVEKEIEEGQKEGEPVQAPNSNFDEYDKVYNSLHSEMQERNQKNTIDQVEFQKVKLEASQPLILSEEDKKFQEQLIQDKLEASQWAKQAVVEAQRIMKH